MVRDGKYMPQSGYSVVIEFIISLIVLLPILILMIPLVLLFQLINIIKGKKSRDEQKSAQKYSENVEEYKTSNSKRDFDLILYGATGFTGRLAALYIAKQYGSTKFRWVLRLP